MFGKKTMIGTSIAAAVIIAGSYFGYATTKADGSSKPQSIQLVQQPPSAKDVASSLGCGKFKDLGSAPDVGVVDSGSCYIGSDKYAINTFVSPAVRDNWLKAAENFGVNPKWETNYAVVYPSVG